MFARRSNGADEKRLLDYFALQTAFSETPISLGRKLHLDVRLVRTVLDQLVEEGKLHRRAFPDIEPVYYRFTSLEDREQGRDKSRE